MVVPTSASARSWAARPASPPPTCPCSRLSTGPRDCYRTQPEAASLGPLPPGDLPGEGSQRRTPHQRRPHPAPPRPRRRGRRGERRGQRLAHLGGGQPARRVALQAAPDDGGERRGELPV